MKKYISNFSFTFANQFLVKIHKPKYSRYSSLEHRKLFLCWKNINNPKVMRRSYSHIQVFVVRGYTPCAAKSNKFPTPLARAGNKLGLFFKKSSLIFLWEIDTIVYYIWWFDETPRWDATDNLTRDDNGQFCHRLQVQQTFCLLDLLLLPYPRDVCSIRLTLLQD